MLHHRTKLDWRTRKRKAALSFPHHSKGGHWPSLRRLSPLLAAQCTHWSPFTIRWASGSIILLRINQWVPFAVVVAPRSYAQEAAIFEGARMRRNNTNGFPRMLQGTIYSFSFDLATGQLRKGHQTVVHSGCPLTSIQSRSWISREARDPSVLVNVAADALCLYR